MVMRGAAPADLGPVSESAARGILPEPAPDGPEGSEVRERATLVAFVLIAVVATVSWLVLLGWLVVVGLRALGV
jgi:hypothetical protein